MRTSLKSPRESPGWCKVDHSTGASEHFIRHGSRNITEYRAGRKRGGFRVYVASACSEHLIECNLFLLSTKVCEKGLSVSLACGTRRCVMNTHTYDYTAAAVVVVVLWRECACTALRPVSISCLDVVLKLQEEVTICDLEPNQKQYE